MNQHSPRDTGQLGFDALLGEADAANAALRFERATGHLPGNYAEAIPFYRNLIEQHHAAMLAANVEAVMGMRQEAHALALRLNGGEPGILAHDDAPGYVLARETAAPEGSVPLWGQDGAFTVDVSGMSVRIEMDGMFGIGSTALFWPGFAARAVDPDAPFLSETGYRSFLGLAAAPVSGMTPDGFACEAIAAHVRRALKGKLLTIEPRYRERKEGGAA